MPKSRRSRAKRWAAEKKHRTAVVSTAHQQAVAGGEKPKAPQDMSAPASSLRTSSPAPSLRTTAPAMAPAPLYPYVATELRRICILAGIMIVILVVLALVLP